MADPLPTPGLPCPECRERLLKNGNDIEGMNRIGNRRGTCTTCNNFTQAVARNVAKRLKALHAEEAEKLRLRVEMDLYPGVIERWNVKKEIPK
ncbi:hypothetical protein SEA_RASPUTIA_149 [Microbacterium phage Rasputia]|nr:hypothetical protein SEA_RASPUTIA_149 [Microbacterium phage Rasputia]